MEKIKFKKAQSIAKFLEWIEKFKGEISGNNLTIEMDFTEEKFISKTFTQDRSLVRSSKISFTDAGFEVVGIPDSFDKSKRVLFGTITLDKFISLLKIFETSGEFTMSPSFELEKVGETEAYCTRSILFKSKKLTMNCVGASIVSTGMTPLDDDTLNNRIMVCPEPVKVTVSGDLIKNIICISDIFLNAEQNKNYMEFYTTTDEEGKKVMKVCDPENGSYDYDLGEIEGDLQKDIKLCIYRNRFLIAVKNMFEDTSFTISSQNPTRIIIQLNEGETKTVIAKCNR